MRRRCVLGGALAVAGTVAGARSRRWWERNWAAGTLPGRCGSRINSYFNRPTYRYLRGALNLGPDDAVLDLACGWGEFLSDYTAPAARVAGIDLSEEKAGLARERLAGRIATRTAEVVQGDAAQLPWPDDTFTAVTCMDAFAFFPDPGRVLAEALRVLRPGGRMLMQIGMKWPDGPPKHMPHPRSPVDVSDEAVVRTMVADAGFAEVTVSYSAVGGESRLANLVGRVLGGSDELRFVGGTKPGA